MPSSLSTSTSAGVRRILLLGGHGKIALLMTPLLVKHPNWHLTSVVRSEEHARDIEAAAAGEAGVGMGGRDRLEVLLNSLDEVRSEGDAARVIERLKPEWIVWSAGRFFSSLLFKICLWVIVSVLIVSEWLLNGWFFSSLLTICFSLSGAGGKGGPERTYAIDRDAAIYYIRAAAHSTSVKLFLTVSYLNSRRNRAPWWDNDDDWAAAKNVNENVLPHYAKAKLAADECLTALAQQLKEKEPQRGFRGIVLRPGTLTDKMREGKVSLGKTRAKGVVSRADVADVAVKLLEQEEGLLEKGRASEGSWWVDLLSGEEETGEAVERIQRENVDCVEGEDVKAMMQEYKL
jgi:hypothetical protein